MFISSPNGNIVSSIDDKEVIMADMDEETYIKYIEAVPDIKCFFDHSGLGYHATHQSIEIQIVKDK